MLSAETILEDPTKRNACELITSNEGNKQSLAIASSILLWKDSLPFRIIWLLDRLTQVPVDNNLHAELEWIKKNSVNPLDADDSQAIWLLKESIQSRLSVVYSSIVSTELCLDLREIVVILLDAITKVAPGLIDDSYITHSIYLASQDALFAAIPNLIKSATCSNSRGMLLAQAIYCNASGSHDQAIKMFNQYFEESSEEAEPPKWAFVKYADSCLRVGRDRYYIEATCTKFPSFDSTIVLTIANRLKETGPSDQSLQHNYEFNDVDGLIAYYIDANYAYTNPERSAALTIVSRNYLALALTLANSFLDTHQGSQFFIVVVDSQDGIDKLASREGLYFIPYELIPIPDSQVFRYRYSILELNTAVKPFALSYVLSIHSQIDKLLYIDPDIKIYSCLSDIWDALEFHNICLTPHLLSPINDSKSPSEINILQSGSYNLGFIGLRRSNAANDLLEWWQERLFLECRVDIPAGLFTDQKWIDLIPGYFEECKIIRKHQYNVAYWNLHERSASLDSFGRAYINDQPLRFFHFSGYSPAHPHVISKHQDRHQLSRRQDLLPLFTDYAKCLVANGYIELSKIPYAFSYLPCGIKNSRAIRWVLDRAARCDQTIIPDLSNKRLVLEFLTKINARITNGLLLPPILAAIIKIRKDVGNYYSFHDGRLGDRSGLVNWCSTAGCTEEDLDTLINALKDENMCLDPITTSDVQVIVTALENRFDLQEHLGIFWNSSDSIQRLKGWIAGSGLSELGISSYRIPSICDAFRYGVDKILHTYFMRSDLQEVFPRIYDSGTLESFCKWMHSNISQVANITHDDIDAFRFVYGKKVDIFPVMLWNSQWIRAFIPQPRTGVNKAILDTIEVEPNRYETALDIITSKNEAKIAHATMRSSLPPLIVNVAGNFSASTGIGQSARTLCKSLDNIDRAVTQVLWTLPTLFPSAPSFDQSSLVANRVYDQAHLSIAVCNADSTPYLKKQVPKQFWNASRKVGYWVWETERLPQSMLEECDLYDEIWTPSEYSACAIRATTSKPVYVVPHSLPTETFIRENYDQILNRIEQWNPADSLKLGFFYDSKSYSQRKNPDAFLDLVEDMQSSGFNIDPIIKVSSPTTGDYRYEQFIHRAKKARARVILDTLSDIEIYNLYLELDFYISLHRSEGFGLTCAEALSLGVLTVATEYSGNLEFMNASNSLLVGGNPYVLSTDCGPYPYGTTWVNPFIHLAKSKILQAVKSPSESKRIMINSVETTLKSLSARSIGKVISLLIRQHEPSTTLCGDEVPPLSSEGSTLS